MHKIAYKLMEVKRRIQQAARLSGRDPAEISLLAVSKKQPLSAINEVYLAGQRDFGENYVQEGLAKVHNIALSGICWHFIGPIQGNKVKKIAENFHWVHSVDRLKTAQKLSDNRPEAMGPLNVCLQINIDGEQSKSGVAPENALPVAKCIAQMPNLKLRGLMTIPASIPVLGNENNAFLRMRCLFNELKLHDPGLSRLDTLSMGMSADLEQAIWEGSTLVRVGTDLFGPREGNIEIERAGEAIGQQDKP